MGINYRALLCVGYVFENAKRDEIVEREGEKFDEKIHYLNANWEDSLYFLGEIETHTDLYYDPDGMSMSTDWFREYAGRVDEVKQRVRDKYGYLFADGVEPQIYVLPQVC